MLFVAAKKVGSSRHAVVVLLGHGDPVLFPLAAVGDMNDVLPANDQFSWIGKVVAGWADAFARSAHGGKVPVVEMATGIATVMVVGQWLGQVKQQGIRGHFPRPRNGRGQDGACKGDGQAA